MSSGYAKLLLTTLYFRWSFLCVLVKLPLSEVLILYRKRGGLPSLLRYYPLATDEQVNSLKKGRYEIGFPRDRDILLFHLKSDVLRRVLRHLCGTYIPDKHESSCFSNVSIHPRATAGSELDEMLCSAYSFSMNSSADTPACFKMPDKVPTRISL